MGKRSVHRLTALSLALACAPSPSGAATGGPIDGAEQLLVVTTPGFDSTRGLLRRFEKKAGRWQRVGGPVAVQVGRAGLGWGRGRFPSKDEALPPGPVKREGDRRAPAGIFALGTLTGYAASPPPGTRLPYLQATPSLRCVDDEGSPEYNRFATAPGSAAPPWRSDEHMRRDDGLYELTIFVGHNVEPARPGGGSCIFLHVAADPPRPTVGCTAMTLPALREVVTFLDPARHPLLVQLPERTYASLRRSLELPPLR